MNRESFRLVAATLLFFSVLAAVLFLEPPERLNEMEIDYARTRAAMCDIEFEHLEGMPYEGLHAISEGLDEFLDTVPVRIKVQVGELNVSIERRWPDARVPPEVLMRVEQLQVRLEKFLADDAWKIKPQLYDEQYWDETELVEEKRKETKKLLTLAKSFITLRKDTIAYFFELNQMKRQNSTKEQSRE